MWLVPAREIVGAIGSARPGPLAIALLVSLGSHGLLALRLGLLARQMGVRWSFMDALGVHARAMAVGVILPLGGLVAATSRGIELARNSDVGRATAVVIADRVAATTTLAATGLLAATSGVAQPDGLRVAFAALTLAGLLLLFALACPPTRLRRLRLPIFTTATALLVSLPIHAGGILAYYEVARAIGTQPTLAGVAISRAAMLLAAMPPVTIGGLGLREAAATWSLGALGVPAAKAVAFSLLAFTVANFIPAVFAILLGGLMRPTSDRPCD